MNFEQRLQRNREIASLRKKGVSLRGIARKYDMSHQNIKFALDSLDLFEKRNAPGTLGAMGLGYGAVCAVSRYTGKKVPIPDDFKEGMANPEIAARLKKCMHKKEVIGLGVGMGILRGLKELGMNSMAFGMAQELTGKKYPTADDLLAWRRGMQGLGFYPEKGTLQHEIESFCHKYGFENPSLCYFGASVRAVNILRWATGSDAPGILDLGRFYRENPDERERRMCLRRFRNCGIKTVTEIEELAKRILGQKESSA
jgi:hypothetical protein